MGKPTLGIDRHRAHLEPRFSLEEGRMLVDCMICGDTMQMPYQDRLGTLKDPDRVLTLQEGLYPDMFAHAACCQGRTGQALQLIYLSTIGELFRGEKPLMVN